MSRWNWLNNRARRLHSGTQQEILQDIAYCLQREQMAKLKSGVKAWRVRREEAESVLALRFGQEDIKFS
jgi:hypothetical protein